VPLRTPQWTLVLAAVATLTFTTAASCDGLAPDAGSPTGTTPTGSSSAAQTAFDQLDELTVATKAGSMKGYSREKFPHWRTTGSNCDVRDAVLKRDGSNVKFSGCNVVAGTWSSSYDGKLIRTPKEIDVDHMVPLANAWRSGASAWTTEKRSDFANDMVRPQLIAVSINANRSKGDQDPSTWKPTVQSSWCEYAEHWIAVKAYWKLTVVAKEKSALTDMLETCS
jgi:hypothetical protein